MAKLSHPVTVSVRGYIVTALSAIGRDCLVIGRNGVVAKEPKCKCKVIGKVPAEALRVHSGMQFLRFSTGKIVCCRTGKDAWSKGAIAAFDVPVEKPKRGRKTKAKSEIEIPIEF